ncbi:MAG: hypothetical protein PHN78_07290 [Dehalococcoidales bacterium]|nr:hypothetical protein [Dehalococcoidales bacterium]
MAKAPRWAVEELDYLNDNYGVTPDDTVCRHLNRSVNALKIVSYRKLGINRKTNIYTARTVADILGVACSKTITAWMRRGWIKGEKTSIHCGGGLIWNFPYENIEAFVRGYPWLFNRDKMEESYFRSIVIAEYERDPWYSLSQACKMIGVSCYSSAMAKYIKKRWLHPVKKLIEGGNHWTWVFRKSDLDNFMGDDPRRYDIPNKIKSRQLHRLREGRAIQAYMVWKMKCPICRQRVTIEANPRMLGYNVKVMFQEKYCSDGVCNHTRLCRVAKPLKPYVVRKSEGRTKTYLPHWLKNK